MITVSLGLYSKPDLFEGDSGAGEETVAEVCRDADHGAKGKTQTKHLRPQWVRVAVVVGQQLELRPHPDEDTLRTATPRYHELRPHPDEDTLRTSTPQYVV